MMRAMIAALALALTGCATGSASGTRPAATSDTIRFSALAGGRCSSACPVYSITVKPDGEALLVPRQFTAVPGETRLSVTPAQYRQFRAAFAAYRPLTGKSKKLGIKDDCKRLATHHAGYEILWSREGAKDTELYFYSGCHDAKYAKLRAAIASVPKLLDIEAMLRTKPQ